MPAPLVKSFAKKVGMPLAKVEKFWDKAKSVAKTKLKMDEKDKNFYAVVVGILKNMLGLKEEEIGFVDYWMVNMFEAYPADKYNVSYSEIVEGRKPTGWEDKAMKGWKGEQLSAAEIARRGGVSKVAVSKAIKDTMSKIFKKLVKQEPDATMADLATTVANVFGIKTQDDYIDFKKTLPKFVIDQLKKEARGR